MQPLREEQEQIAQARETAHDLARVIRNDCNGKLEACRRHQSWSMFVEEFAAAFNEPLRVLVGELHIEAAPVATQRPGAFDDRDKEACRWFALGAKASLSSSRTHKLWAAANAGAKEFYTDDTCLIPAQGVQDIVQDVLNQNGVAIKLVPVLPHRRHGPASTMTA